MTQPAQRCTLSLVRDDGGDPEPRRDELRAPPLRCSPDTHDATLLVLVETPAVGRLFARLLSVAGFTNVHVHASPQEALDAWPELDPDLVMADLHTLTIDGDLLIRRISSLADGENVPVMVMTADTRPETRDRVLAAGATDFLLKPVDSRDMVTRIDDLLHVRLARLAVVERNTKLGRRVELRTRSLESARLETLERLAKAAEFRDDETGMHTVRVGRLAASIASGMGLSADAVEQIRLAAPLHDVGKIAVPDAILLKPGALTAEERTIMQRHTTSGAELLSGSSSSLLLLAERIAAAHHERWDGGGYPLGLARKEIDVAARITSVAEIVDALVHRRPYKEAWSLADAMDYIVHGAGSQFDPAVVTAFSRMDPQVLAATTEPHLPLAAGLRGVTTPSR